MLLSMLLSCRSGYNVSRNGGGLGSRNYQLYKLSIEEGQLRWFEKKIEQHPRSENVEEKKEMPGKTCTGKIKQAIEGKGIKWEELRQLIHDWER